MTTPKINIDELVDSMVGDPVREHQAKGVKTAKKNFTKAFSGAVLALGHVVKQTQRRHDDEVDGTNAATAWLICVRDWLLSGGDPFSPPQQHAAVEPPEVSLIPDPTDELSRRLTDLQGRYDELKGDLDDMTRERNNALASLGEKTDELATTKRELTEAKANLETAGLEVHRLNGELTTTNGKLTEANATIARLNRENSDLQTRVTTETAKAATAEEEVVRATANASAEQDRATTAETRLRAHDRDANAFRVHLAQTLGLPDETPVGDIVARVDELIKGKEPKAPVADDATPPAPADGVEPPTPATRAGAKAANGKGKGGGILSGFSRGKGGKAE